MAEETKSVLLRKVPESVHRRWKIRAASEGKTLEQMIIELSIIGDRAKG
jgi:plasmid stability protein